MFDLFNRCFKYSISRSVPIDKYENKYVKKELEGDQIKLAYYT